MQLFSTKSNRIFFLVWLEPINCSDTEDDMAFLWITIVKFVSKDLFRKNLINYTNPAIWNQKPHWNQMKLCSWNSEIELLLLTDKIEFIKKINWLNIYQYCSLSPISNKFSNKTQFETNFIISNTFVVSLFLWSIKLSL